MSNDGGPAFARNERMDRFGDSFGEGQIGMSLRDYFAGKALQGLCANPAVFAANGINGWKLVNCSDADLTSYTYFLADKMLQGRGE